MKFTALTLTVAAFCASPVHAVRRARRSGDVHPIEKVVKMLQGLMAKTEAEAKGEEVSYTKFEYWCRNSKKTLDSAIADSEENIKKLTAGIDSRLEEEALLDDQIADLDEEIKEQETAGKEADKVRKETADLYKTTDDNFAATIKAIEESQKLLEKSYKETDKLLLAQQKVSNLLVLVQSEATSEQLSVMQAFVAEQTTATTPRPKQLAKGDRATHVKKYAFKSGSVIEILKQLSLKFQDEKLAATEAETNSINAYELAKNARDDAIKQAKESKKEKTSLLAAAKDDRAKMESSRTSAKKDLSDDSDTLERTKKACVVKAAEWSERSETRKLELEAIEMAIKILAKVGGVRTEAPSNPIPPSSPVKSASLLETSTDPKVKAMRLLRESAVATHSRALERVAQEISATAPGHFDQVINMIEKMIFRLMDEQKDEDNHKNWCDEELQKTDVSIKNKAKKMAELDAKAKEAEALVASLTAEIEDADKMVNKITEHMAEATDIRKIGKKENKLAVKDAEDAQQAVSNAISVLESFYKESGMVKKEAWELLQAPVKLPETPSTWDSGYTGVADPVKKQPDGIITVLKQVSADFAKMESDTMAQEETDQKLYEEEIKSCEIEKARRTSESKEKSAEKKRQSQMAVSLKSSHKTVAGEKESVEQYLKDLQHGCVDGDSTYADRKAARAKEIKALKQAEQTLTDAFKDETKKATLMVLRR